jgi:hypothetical protein
MPIAELDEALSWHRQPQLYGHRAVVGEPVLPVISNLMEDLHPEAAWL